MEILLTIAIPTYNRGDILKETLQSIISDPMFNKGIEIVLSDNNSNDNTEEVGRYFNDNYENIKYFRFTESQPVEINAKNAMSLATGQYIKLSNDTIRFEEGGLEKIIDGIKRNSAKKNTLFFYQNTKEYSFEERTITTFDSFVQHASYWVTWNANYGMWKSDFDSIEDKQINVKKITEVSFQCVRWLLDLVIKNNSTVIIFDNFYRTTDNLKNKGGYDFFEVFVAKYLSIYDDFIKNGSLSIQQYELEKKILFCDFAVQWYYKIKVNTGITNYTFSTIDAEKVFFKYYKTKPYFYKYMVWTWLRLLKKKIFV